MPATMGTNCAVPPSSRICVPHYILASGRPARRISTLRSLFKALAHKDRFDAAKLACFVVPRMHIGHRFPWPGAVGFGAG